MIIWYHQQEVESGQGREVGYDEKIPSGLITVAQTFLFCVIAQKNSDASELFNEE